MSHVVSSLSDEFLSLLVDELNNENVTALALVGSYAHGDATPYSDIDVLCFVHEATERARRYVYRDGRLIGISTRTIAQYRKRFTIPEEAIFVVPSIRDARVLLDKEGALAALQQEAQAWTWEPLQAAANGEIPISILLTPRPICTQVGYWHRIAEVCDKDSTSNVHCCVSL